MGNRQFPVVFNNEVLLTSGKVAALDLKTGAPLWTSKDANMPAYTTTVVFNRNGQDLVAALDDRGLSILSAKDGAEIARHPFKSNYDVTATTPVVLDRGARIFLTGNAGAEMLAFDGKALSVLWTSQDLKSTMNNCVIFNGVMYGIDGPQDNAATRLVSVNEADGHLNWAKDSFGFGQTLGVGSYLLAINENGELVTVKPGPARYDEISRVQVLGKKCWTTPTFAGGRIYVRNDHGNVACLASP